MAFCTPEELVAASNRGEAIYTYRPQTMSYTNGYGSNMHFYYEQYPNRVTLDTAREIIERCREATKNHNQAKINRPYILVPSTTRDLDQNDDWVGWEIECGWYDQANYDRAVDYIWDEQQHVTIDIEGAGLPTEITWSPANGRDMYAGNSQVHRFLDWVRTSGVRPATWRENQGVGTHCNISTPLYRERGGSETVQIVNQLLGSLNDTENRELFGRGHPYGLGFAQNAGGQRWVEFKLFNSTLDRDRFDGYVRVAERLGRLIDHCIQHGSRGETMVTVPNDHPVVQAAYEARIANLVANGYDRVTAEHYAHINRSRHTVTRSNVADFLRGRATEMRSVCIPQLQFTVAQKRELMAHAEELYAATNR